MYNNCSTKESNLPKNQVFKKINDMKTFNFEVWNQIICYRIMLRFQFSESLADFLYKRDFKNTHHMLKKFYVKLKYIIKKLF